MPEAPIAFVQRTPCPPRILGSGEDLGGGTSGSGRAEEWVMGRAGDHQVDGVKNAYGHAYGGGAQYFAMWWCRRSGDGRTGVPQRTAALRMRRSPRVRSPASVEAIASSLAPGLQPRWREC